MLDEEKDYPDGETEDGPENAAVEIHNGKRILIVGDDKGEAARMLMKEIRDESRGQLEKIIALIKPPHPPVIFDSEDPDDYMDHLRQSQARCPAKPSMAWGGKFGKRRR